MSYEGFLQVALAKGIGNVTLKKIMGFLQDRTLSWSDLCCDDSLLNDVFSHKKDIVQSIYAQSANVNKIIDHVMEKK